MNLFESLRFTFTLPVALLKRQAGPSSSSSLHFFLSSLPFTLLSINSLLKKKKKTHFELCVCGCGCVHMSVGTRAGWTRAPDSLELELEAIVS